MMYYEYVETKTMERMKLLDERDNNPDAEPIILTPEVDPALYSRFNSGSSVMLY